MSAPLALHNPARLFICRTKKAFHSQPRKLYLTCTWYRLIFLKCVSIHSRTAQWPVIYLESKEHQHDRGSKDFLITLLIYMSLICSPWCLSPRPHLIQPFGVWAEVCRSLQMAGFRKHLGRSDHSTEFRYIWREWSELNLDPRLRGLTHCKPPLQQPICWFHSPIGWFNITP